MNISITAVLIINLLCFSFAPAQQNRLHEAYKLILQGVDSTSEQHAQEKNKHWSVSFSRGITWHLTDQILNGQDSTPVPLNMELDFIQIRLGYQLDTRNEVSIFFRKQDISHRYVKFILDTASNLIFEETILRQLIGIGIGYSYNYFQAKDEGNTLYTGFDICLMPRDPLSSGGTGEAAIIEIMLGLKHKILSSLYLFSNVNLCSEISAVPLRNKQ